MAPVQSQLNPIHAVPRYFFEIHFNVPSHLVLGKWQLPSLLHLCVTSSVPQLGGLCFCPCGAHATELFSLYAKNDGCMRSFLMPFEIYIPDQ
jgi:hypothetical protein